MLAVSILVNLGILGFFKYFNFFIDSFNPLAAIFGGNLDYLHLNIILPVGISFYTFQTMSYTIDIYKEKLAPTNNLLDFALFVSFFPQLVAGPIERARNLIPQLSKVLSPTKQQIEEGLALIVVGLFKKVMIGDTTGKIVDHIFANQEYYSSAENLFGLLLFTIQIYADFSGYSSIARGTAKLLGVELMKNFTQPYLASNISEFWRRWHISLSYWIKDYLFFPLGGSKKGRIRTYINTIITLMIIGLWHGADWTFVVYGLFHGTYLCIHRYMLNGRKIAGKYTYTGIKSLATYIPKVVGLFLLISFTRIFFRAQNFDEVIVFFNKMIYWEPSDLTGRFAMIYFSFLALMLLIDLVQYEKEDYVLIKGKVVSYAVLSALFFLTLIYMFQTDPLPFVYFQF